MRELCNGTFMLEVILIINQLNNKLTQNRYNNHNEIKNIPWLLEIIPSQTDEFQQAFSSENNDERSVNIE